MPKRYLNRGQLVTLIHVGKKDLALDDDTYRDLLVTTTGQTSTKAMTLAQLQAVLGRMQQVGFKIQSKRPAHDLQQQADDAQSRLIRHLWLLLHQHGAVRDPSERALARFLERQMGISALQFISSANASRTIERLKHWLKRIGHEYVPGAEAAIAIEVQNVKT